MGPRALLRQQRGVATIEFAFASVFFFAILMVGLDFGVYAQQNLKLGSAVEQGAMIAFTNRSGAVNTTQIGNYVTSMAGGTPTMSYRCNGSTDCSGTATQMCIGAPATSGGWPTFTSPNGTGSSATCTSGATPGSYLVIRATRTYQSVVVPNKYLSGGTMQQQAVVRLS